MPLNNPPIKPNPSKNKEDLEAIKEGLENMQSQSAPDNFSDHEDLDSKKEFFCLMSEKIKEDPSEPDLEQVKSVSDSRLSFYRKVVGKFSFLVLILLLLLAYLSLGKVKITVSSDRETIKDSLNFYTYSDNGQFNLDRAIKANINTVELETEMTFESSEEEKQGGEIVGKVKIINEHTKNQPLVATTRLLSPNDELFRIKNTVNVPAGGSVEVEIYADEDDPKLALGPSTFTIPGLWAGLQDKIYAVSSEAFEFKTEVKRVVSSQDIVKAQTALREEILKIAQENNPSQKGIKNIYNLDSENSSIKIGANIDDEVEEFKGNIKARINIISINLDDLLKIIKQRLAILDFDQNLSEVDTETLEFELLNFNSEKTLAEFQVNFIAYTRSKERGMLNKKHLVSLNEKQIKAYLDGIDNLKSYELEFWPSFIKRAPMLSSRIDIIYE
ncbi:MAG: hypothetical protein ACOXZ1_02035 [Patescibacteria group bacterium]|jgi:hypothetical protein